jgi:hypothetical protein
MYCIVCLVFPSKYLTESSYFVCVKITCSDQSIKSNNDYNIDRDKHVLCVYINVLCVYIKVESDRRSKYPLVDQSQPL